jgi:hypothetical protein
VDDKKLTPDAAAELRKIRAEIAAIRARGPVPFRYGWLKFVIKDLETNPHTQYRVHFYGVLYWLLNFPLITLLFFFEPTLWLKLGIFITLIYSIYANFATDYGSMSAAMAAYGGQPLPAIPMDSAGMDAHYQQQTVIHDLLQQNTDLTTRIDQATSLLDEIHRHVSALAPEAGKFPPGQAPPRLLLCVQEAVRC